MDEKPDVVIFSPSIMALDSVLSKFPTSRYVHFLPIFALLVSMVIDLTIYLASCFGVLLPSAFVSRSLSKVLVVDVLSVKMFPQELLLRHLPSDADILCTHPMFGPESGRDSWKELPFVYDRIRIDSSREERCQAFLDIWALEGCKMILMTCSQHDAYAASTQFLTHTTGTQTDVHSHVHAVDSCCTRLLCSEYLISLSYITLYIFFLTAMYHTAILCYRSNAERARS